MMHNTRTQHSRYMTQMVISMDMFIIRIVIETVLRKAGLILLA